MIEERPLSRTIVGRAGTRVSALLPKDDWIVVGWVAAIKVLLFFFGAQTYQVLENKPVPGFYAALQIWNRWDAPAYQKLAQFGYQASSEFKTWFYPFFPWTVRLLAHLTGDYLVSALLVSGIASAVAAVLLRRLVELDFAPPVAQRAVWFFLIFPTAYFLHIGYTESLFLVLILGATMAARKECWWLAGVLGAMSCMTRAPGLVLIPTLAVEVGQQYFFNRRLRWQWLWLMLVPLGFGVYLLTNWWVAGDAFAFVRLKKELFASVIAWPWVGLRDAFGRLNEEPSRTVMIAAQELIFTALGLICAIVSWIKLRPLYAMWISGNWMLVCSVTFLSGIPRYTLAMFPIFILFALAGANRFVYAILAVWSLLFFAFFASLFSWGHWAF